MDKIGKSSEKVRIDKKDIEIISILEDDGRLSILELSKRVKLSHETVRYRINKLLRQGIIKKFTLKIDKKKLGYEIYAVIMVIIGNFDKNRYDTFFKFLMDHSAITAIEKVTGNYDLKFAFWARNTEEFDSISHKIKTEFSDIIRGWNSFIFTKRFKSKELPF